jgi:hypothetical protein
MQLLSIFKEILTGFIQASSWDWWVKITTAQPRCIYYFGPFSKSRTAEAAYTGYVEDLKGEGARGIHVCIQRCNPETLTICADET